MIANLSERAEALVRELDRQAQSGGRERLMAYLARQARAQGGQAVTLEASKAAIAARLNVTPAHFSRLLRELEAADVLRVQGRRIVVLDPRRLARRPESLQMPSS
jgi:CRP-like cAMP-binding protein